MQTFASVCNQLRLVLFCLVLSICTAASASATSPFDAADHTELHSTARLWPETLGVSSSNATSAFSALAAPDSAHTASGVMSTAAADTCPGLITTLAPTHKTAAGTTEVRIVVDTAACTPLPSLTLRLTAALAGATAKVFDWFGPGFTCPPQALSCVYDEPTFTLTVRVSTATQTIVVPSVVFTPCNTVTVTVSATLDGDTTPVLTNTGVIASCAPYKLPQVPTLIHVTQPPAGSSNILVGAKLEAATPTQALLDVVAMTAVNFRVQPLGFIAYHACSLRVRYIDSPNWAPGFDRVSTATVTQAQGRFAFQIPQSFRPFSQVSGLYVACTLAGSSVGVGTGVLEIRGSTWAASAEATLPSLSTVPDRYLGFTLVPTPTVSSLDLAPFITLAKGSLLSGVVMRTGEANGEVHVTVSYVGADSWAIVWSPTGGVPAAGQGNAVSSPLRALFLASRPAVQWALKTGSFVAGVPPPASFLCSVNNGNPAPCAPSTSQCRTYVGALGCYLTAGQTLHQHACWVSDPYGAALPASTPCEPRVTFVNATYDLSKYELTVEYDTDPTQNTEPPFITFFLRTEPAGVMNWFLMNTCPPATCVPASDGQSIHVTPDRITVAAPKGSFTIATPPKIAVEMADLIVTATVAGSETPILTPAARIPLPRHMTRIPLPAPAVTFAPDTAGSSTGTLNVIIKPPAGAASFFSAMGIGLTNCTIDLGEGWALPTDPNSCYGSHRDPGINIFYFTSQRHRFVSITGSTLALLTLDAFSGVSADFTIVCMDVTAPPAADTPHTARVIIASENHPISFHPEEGTFLFDTSMDTNTPHYIGFAYTASGEVTRENLRKLEKAMIIARVQGVAVVMKQVGDRVYGTFVFTGGDRVLLSNVLAEPVWAHLFNEQFSAIAGVTLTALPPPYEVGFGPGRWDCASRNGDGSCAVAPARCGNVYAATECVRDVGGTPTSSDYACLVPSTETAAPVPDYSGCAGLVNALDATYTVASGRLNVTYGVDAAAFSGSPSLTLTLSTEPAGLFDWGASACPAGLTCTFPASAEAADAMRLAITVPAVSAGRSVELDSSILFWHKTAKLRVHVAVTGHESFSVTGALPVEFAIPPVGVYALSATSSVSFTPDAAGAAAKGRLVVALEAAAGAVLAGSHPLSGVSSARLAFPAGWSVEGAVCSVRVRAPSSGAPPNPWLFALPAAAAASVTPAGVLTFSTPPGDLSTADSLYIVCDGATQPSTGLGNDGPVAVSLETLEAFLAEATATLQFDPSAALAARRFVGFALHATEGALAAAKYSAAVSGGEPGVSLALARTTGDAVAVTVGLAGRSRAFEALLARAPAVASLAAVLSAAGAPDVAWTSPGSAVVRGDAGEWKCAAAGGSFGGCALPNNCGSLAAPATCVVDDTDTPAPSPAYACAFDTAPPESETSGCGAWACKSPAGAFVPCTDVSICTQGCAVGVTVTPELVAADARFEQFCVLGGAVVADASALCPTPLVPAAQYRETCTAASECALQCMDADNVARSCDSDLTWSECAADDDGSTCGVGERTRHVYCAATAVAIGVNVTSASSRVPTELCTGTAGAIEMTRPCFGALCANYAWKCGNGAGGYVDCVLPSGADVDTGYSGCEGVCGETTQTRDVFCVAYAAGGAVRSAAADDWLCLARAPKPAESKPCASDSCAPAALQWRCYAPKSDPALASDCAADFGFTCPVDGCAAASQARRGLACFDTDADVQLPDAKCAALAKPSAERACTAISAGCSVDFTGAPCELDSAGGALAADPAQCVGAVGDSSGVFRRGVCRDAASGAAVTGACADASLLSECTLPVCGGEPVFEWRTAPAGACVPGCRSYQPLGVTCAAATDGTAAVVVDESLCRAHAAAPRPAAYEPCAASVCEQAAECIDVPTVVGGVSVPSILGACACPAGFGGPLCGLNATLTAFSVDVPGGALNWEFPGATPASVKFLTATVTSAARPVPVVLAVIPAHSPVPVASLVSTAAPAPAPLSAPQSARAFALRSLAAQAFAPLAAVAHRYSPVGFSGFAAGSYEAQLSAGLAPDFSRTAPFTITGDCNSGAPGTACVNGGTCNTDTGMCACVGDFSGPTCAVSPCPARGCNPLTSWCDITLESTGVCVCRPGFTGALCGQLKTPCAAEQCLHGGWRAPLRQSGAAATCGGCHCLHHWTGAQCETCALQCPAGGAPNSDCSSCTACPAGHHGAACGLRHAVLKLNFHKSSAFDWYEAPFTAAPAALRAASTAAPRAGLPASPAAAEAWATSLERTVDGLVRLSVPALATAVTARLASYRRLNDTEGAEFVQVTLLLGEFDARTAPPAAAWPVHEALRQLRPHFIVPALAPGPTSTPAPAPAAGTVPLIAVGGRGAAAESLTGFGGLYLGRGVGMKDPLCDTAAAGSDCPVGTLQEAEIDEWTPHDGAVEGSGGSSNTTAIAVGVGVGVGGFLLILIVALLLRKKLCDSTTPAPTPSGVEMQSWAAENTAGGATLA